MKKHIIFLPLVALLASCAIFGPSVAKFDQNSYAAALQLKTEASALVPKGYETATLHAQEIISLQSGLDAQVAYEKGKGNGNLASSKQWDILASKDHALLGRFLEDWRKGEKPFSRAFCVEKSKQIEKAFDEILNAEGAKPK